MKAIPTGVRVTDKPEVIHLEVLFWEVGWVDSDRFTAIWDLGFHRHEAQSHNPAGMLKSTRTSLMLIVRRDGLLL
jgi:hypothetical protein